MDIYTGQNLPFFPIPLVNEADSNGEVDIQATDYVSR